MEEGAGLGCWELGLCVGGGEGACDPRQVCDVVFSSLAGLTPLSPLPPLPSILAILTPLLSIFPISSSLSNSTGGRWRAEQRGKGRAITGSPWAGEGGGSVAPQTPGAWCARILTGLAPA